MGRGSWKERLRRREERLNRDPISPRKKETFLIPAGISKQRHLSVRNENMGLGGMATQAQDVMGLGCKPQAGGIQEDCMIRSLHVS